MIEPIFNKELYEEKTKEVFNAFKELDKAKEFLNENGITVDIVINEKQFDDWIEKSIKECIK